MRERISTKYIFVIMVRCLPVTHTSTNGNVESQVNRESLGKELSWRYKLGMVSILTRLDESFKKRRHKDQTLVYYDI